MTTGDAPPDFGRSLDSAQLRHAPVGDNAAERSGMTKNRVVFDNMNDGVIDHGRDLFKDRRTPGAARCCFA
ncbi:hypothetical protein K9U39_18515 [Rhodoblastus acidophilus]|uniref:Uncharacterized protein n=1 Tax=Candidatus Rhodoblastus alkanivorans TaxID=2954117 RepID=A0ABS9Z2L2_9HYPH|nr:hypothetical protein [Candidatus Rhodoblastus alkanivorans]MCI4677493.1 hypothetical protein [Candidatus Rhodoblastus alkanivorans]MCI4681852.1 hypothetical protein [Candidatus Rhodoblastus alkanivorans]MDI4642902.1 hypothetical protein [Rhodoblastus acidophilus]